MWALCTASGHRTLMEGRKERQGYPFHHLDHWGMTNLVDFKAGEYPGTQSDPKLSAHLVRCSQMSTQRCRTLASSCAAGLSSLRRSEASMSWVHSFRKGWRGHKKERPVPSAQQEARVYLTGAGPLSRVQWGPLQGTQCPTHSSWYCLPQAASGPYAGSSRTEAAKVPRSAVWRPRVF